MNRGKGGVRLIHTSDWHLGRALYRRKRYDEFEAFLGWLFDTVVEATADALLVAGDVFDNTTPSNRAQELYYRFLCRVAASPCKHVVITSGNHDSPSFLDAPRELLKAINVHVIGNATEPEDEVIVLRNAQGKPELIVCAVPYLRDRDIRVTEAGESAETKEQKLLEGIRHHYGSVSAAAEQRRDELGADIPVVAMGHLFTAGGQTVDGDGVRELYIGSLALVSTDVFPPVFDYVALGHLHVPQVVKGCEHIRYSGSPLPIGFGEARQQKSVCLVDFAGTRPTVQLLDVPVFQQLETIKGNWDVISCRIEELARSGSNAWLEVEYSSDEILGDLRDRLDSAIADTSMEILRVQNNRIVDRVLRRAALDESLEDLDINDVFLRCLESHDVPDHQRPELISTYTEAVNSLSEIDGQAD